MNTVFFLVFAYLLGSVPFGWLIGKWVRGVDLREHGSGNIGATNVFRVVSKKWGIFALFLDALKGYAGVSIPVWILGRTGNAPFALGLGAAAILGHSFPVWLKFKGGKGVATALGVFLSILPVPALLTFLFWAVCFAITRIISLSSLAAAAVFPLVVGVFLWGTPGFTWLLAVSLALAAFIFYTHRANIARLRRGEEKRLI
ncbi:MAG: glycerol-3-phosphate 1-O-acyltransferase PlsY [Candidatus Omnitrophota bacterium]|jgi:glycerol-3-phosphate acyltransferase PlsY